MNIEDKIRILADNTSQKLDGKVHQRMKDMQSDDKSHYLIYRVLGISHDEGELIDLYQNKGRFLYRYAGKFLEDVSKLCFQEKYPQAASLRIPNSIGQRPKTFEIDCLIGSEAYEIKWRDATTDGDHITKEHTRIRTIAQAGYTPIRLMYYYPNRQQAMRVQATLEDLYKANSGFYYYADSAWQHIHDKTGINLNAILEKIAEERTIQ